MMQDFFTGMFWGFMAGVIVASVAASFVVWWELKTLRHYKEE